MKIWGSNYLTTDAGDLWTSWASLDKHHWTHLSRSDMASRSGIASRSDIVGRSDIQSVGSVFLLVLTRLSVRSNGIYIYIYIYIYIKREGPQVCSFSGWPFLGTLYHTYVAKTPPEHTFLRYTARQACRQTCRAIAYNSIESQHGLLVVQGSISIACWSSKGISTHAPSCSHPRHQHEHHQ